MSLETTSVPFISDLVENWPTSTDAIEKGDDHLRLLKKVLKNTFPGEGGNGFNTPITAKESELNFLVGVTSPIQGQLDALAGHLIAPAGTVLSFFQPSVPTGWTKLTANNDYMIRIVTGTTGGDTGGNASHTITIGCNIVASHTHTIDATSGTTGSGGGHLHNITYNSRQNGGGGGASTVGLVGDITPATGVFVSFDTDSVADHTHSVSIGATATNANASAAVWQPRYVDCCLGEKS